MTHKVRGVRVEEYAYYIKYFAKTLVWKHEYDVRLWRHKQRTPNTNVHHMPMTETPNEIFLRTPVTQSVHIRMNSSLRPPKNNPGSAYDSACRVNTLVCGDPSKPFSLIHNWKVWLLDPFDWLLAETNHAFEILTVECCTSRTTESKEPLHSLLLAFALSDWLIAIIFCLGLLQKYCFILGWRALRFCCDNIFWKYPHKKINE